MATNYFIVQNCSTIHVHVSKSFQLRLHCLSVLEVDPEKRDHPFFFFKKLAAHSTELTESFDLSYTLEGTPASSSNILFHVHVNFYIVIFVMFFMVHSTNIFTMFSLYLINRITSFNYFKVPVLAWLKPIHCMASWWNSY